jgi:cell division protein ZipA
MTGLRWILLGIALLILLLLFLWTRYKPRLVARVAPVLRSGSAPPADPVPLSLEDDFGSPPAGKSVAPLPTKIITIRILARGAARFPGEDLVLALRAAGLRHGQYGIFHAFAGPDEAQRPIFSVAGLVEPGSFDLTRVATEAYPGVSVFMGLPGPEEGVQAFDAMIRAARSVATRLGGELVDEHGSTLSVQRERYLREEVIQFQHRRSRSA